MEKIFVRSSYKETRIDSSGVETKSLGDRSMQCMSKSYPCSLVDGGWYEWDGKTKTDQEIEEFIQSCVNDANFVKYAKYYMVRYIVIVRCNHNDHPTTSDISHCFKLNMEGK